MSDDSRYKEALRVPSEVYRHPGAVVRDNALSDRQKIEVLEHWEAEAVQLQASESEGLTGGERSFLPEIKRAIREIREK